MLILTLFLACSDATKDKPMATVSETPAKVEAPAVAPPAAVPAGPQVKLPASGTVGFTAAKVTKSHDGSFSEWTGTLTMSGLTLSGVEVTVQVASISTGEERLDKHLKSPDFFDAPTMPTATFVSTAVRPGAPAGSPPDATHTIEGDLAMHGVSKHVIFPARVNVSPDAVMAHAEFGINRKDFGIVYPGKPDDLIKDEVLLKADLIANRSAPATVPAPQ